MRITETFCWHEVGYNKPNATQSNEVDMEYINCTGMEGVYTWQAALLRAQAVNIGAEGENFSQTDWRLPNIKELASIAELRCSNPAINNTIFPNTSSSFFWSSSAFVPVSNSAWDVGFGHGDDDAVGKGNGDFVRLVRSGQ